MKSSTGRIGIIAGTGDLPAHIADSLHRSGEDIFVAGLKGSDQTVLADPRFGSARINLHRMQDALDTLRRAGVTEVILAGKVDHSEIFRTERFDEKALKLMEGLRDTRGSTILTAVVNILEGEGYAVPSLLDVAAGLVPEGRDVYGPVPDGRQIGDLKFGWHLARKIADLDIGQTIVVKGGSVVAVEGMEGTDEAIRRALTLAGNGITVIKLAARNHDFRFDVPTIGRETIDVLSEGKGCTLAFETGRCFIMQMKDVFTLCEEKGVTLLPCSEDENGEVFWPLK